VGFGKPVICIGYIGCSSFVWLVCKRGATPVSVTPYRSAAADFETKFLPRNGAITGARGRMENYV
jgi:hypothetical protein